MIANVHNFLLLTTSNRSEGDVGYCTMDGDTAGSLAPIAGVSKHFIRQWLVWLKETQSQYALDAIINQQPTAELRPQSQNQTDEADLMPYDLLEQIEILGIGKGLSKPDIVRELKATRKEDPVWLEQQVDRFFTLWKRNQWKRERLAPSFHLDRFNIDPRSGGRFPVFSK
jgi:NAD+ synthase (glutamine-hydrolysing)